MDVEKLHRRLCLGLVGGIAFSFFWAFVTLYTSERMKFLAVVDILSCIVMLSVLNLEERNHTKHKAAMADLEKDLSEWVLRPGESITFECVITERPTVH